MKYIQFAKPSIKLHDSDLDNIKEIIESGWFCEGSYVDDLETYMENRCHVEYAIATANATQGLIAALIGAEIRNKKIAIPAFTWPSTLHAVRCSGNTPVFCDINPKTWSMDLTTCKESFDVAIPVDVFGNRSYVNLGIPSIYDAAHGFNIKDLGRRGGLAEIVSFSFTKPVTSGQGGVILTNNHHIYANAREITKLSAKMLEISAYIFFLSLNMPNRKIRVKARNLYRKYIEVPIVEQRTTDDLSTYTILLENQDKKNRVVKAFKENNIEVKTYYEPLINGLPVTDEIYSRIIALPMYEEVYSSIPFIANTINEA